MNLSQEDVKWLFVFLRKVDFLAYHSPDEIEALVESFGRVACRDGRVILRQGEPGSSFFLIREGKVSVRLKGAVKPLASLGPGEYFGEMSLLTGAPRSATVVSDGASVVLSLDAEALRAIVRANPVLAEKITGVISSRTEELKARASEVIPPPEQLLPRIRRFLGL